MSIDELNTYSQELNSLEDNDELLYEFAKSLTDNQSDLDSLEIIQNGSIRVVSNKIILDVLLNRPNVNIEYINFQDKKFKKSLQKRYNRLYKGLQKSEQVYSNRNWFAEVEPTLNPDKLEKSRKKIEGWLTKWVFKASNLGQDLGRLEFRKDGTYILTSFLLGGAGSKGTWEIRNGNAIGEALIILTPPEAQVRAGDVPPKIYVEAYDEDNMLLIGETKYYPIKNPF